MNQPQPKIVELHNRIGAEAFSRLIYVERTLLNEPQFNHLTVLPYDPMYTYTIRN